MTDQKDIYENYITTQFESTHDLANIKKEYKKFSVFIRHNFIKHFNGDKSNKIVDIGCGLGHMLAALKDLGYENSIGIDLSGECVQFCKNQGFSAEQSDALNFLEKQDSAFDVIIMNDIIEHFEKNQIIPVIRACQKALSKDGVLIIKTFNASNPFLGPDARYYDFTHTIGFTQTSLRQVIISGGFQSEQIKVVPSHIFDFYLLNILQVY